MLIGFPREFMNGLTHCIGAVLALTGTVALLVASPVTGAHLTSFAVFGVSMLLLYTASTLYHWLPLSEKGQAMLRRVDHCMIFAYIAGTYTPVCVLALQGVWGWSLLAGAWAVAVTGIFLKIFWMRTPRMVSTGLYVLMGWMVLAGAKPLVAALPGGALAWLVAGGVLYSAGAVIYACKKPNLAKYLGFHELFHLFVMAGSACHFVVMYAYLTKY